LPVYDSIFGEETINCEALKLLVAGLAPQVVDHASFALEAAIDKVIESNGITDFKAFLRYIGSNRLDVSYTFMTERDWVVRPHLLD
jgi:hypothetical protein